MPIESVFVRARPDDPNRCQAIGGNGQCPFMGVYDSDRNIWHKYCTRHGGNGHKKAEERESKRQYMAAKWQERIGRHADHPQAKSLREETGVLRMSLEILLDRCQDAVDIQMNTGSLIELTREIGKLVKAMHLIEKESAQYLTQEQAFQLVTEFSNVIAKYVPDPDLLEFIAEDLLEPLNRMLPDANAQRQNAGAASRSSHPQIS